MEFVAGEPVPTEPAKSRKLPLPALFFSINESATDSADLEGLESKEGAMALVRKFEKVSSRVENIHGEVDCKCSVFEKNGMRYLKICTSGSKNRKHLGTTSQTIQFDDQSAKLLFALLKSEFSLT